MTTLTLPMMNETINKVEVTLNPAKWTPQQAQHMMEGFYLQGARIILQRATAGQDDPQKAVRKKLAELQSGSYSFGGGAHLSTEDKGWIEYFRAIKHKEGGALVSGKNLERAQQTLCREDLLAEFEAGTPEHASVANNMQHHLETRFEEWKTLVENDPADPIGAYIAHERVRVAIDTTQRVSRLRSKHTHATD